MNDRLDAGGSTFANPLNPPADSQIMKRVAGYAMRVSGSPECERQRKHKTL